MNGIPIFLGMLRSKDLNRLRHERRLAIQKFSKQYLISSGAKPALAVDGLSLVNGFLAEQYRYFTKLINAKSAIKRACRKRHALLSVSSLANLSILCKIVEPALSI
jgi:hypothetical protein